MDRAVAAAAEQRPCVRQKGDGPDRHARAPRAAEDRVGTAIYGCQRAVRARRRDTIAIASHRQTGNGRCGYRERAMGVSVPGQEMDVPVGAARGDFAIGCHDDGIERRRQIHN